MSNKEKEARVQLKDILKYETDSFLSQEEVDLIRNTFKYNPQLFRVLRKIFIPSVSTLDLPIEEIHRDMWLVGKEWDQIPADEAKILAVARQDTIKFIVGGLISLKNIAAIEEESEQERKLREEKDSAK